MKIGKKIISIRPLTWGVTAICLLLLAACSVSYKFNGASGFQPASPTVSNLPATSDKQPISPAATIEQVEDAVAEEISEPETLNLNDIGRQLVEKALERNNGNRKKAALELGISDRTLYRRIRQYGLDKD